jgi:peroxiredoxin
MDPVVATGALAPDFSLFDLNGHEHCLSQARGRLLILNFWSAECAWCERADLDLLDGLQAWGERVWLWTIAANAGEARPQIAAEAARRGLTPLLLDTHQQVADLYGAQTTPHLFVIDAAGLLRYQGAFDDVTFRRRTPSVAYLRLAVAALLDERSPDPSETPSYGCTIVRNFY